MLKPGGYLQWQEGNMPAYIARQRESPSSPNIFLYMYAFEQFHLKALAMRPPHVNDWITALGDYLTAQGLEKVKCQTFKVPKKYWRSWTEVLLLIAEEVASRMGSEEYAAIVRGVGGELTKGAIQPNLMPIVAVGRKPLR